MRELYGVNQSGAGVTVASGEMDQQYMRDAGIAAADMNHRLRSGRLRGASISMT